MTLHITLLALAGLAGLVASPALAQSSATVSANGAGRIIAPMALTKDADLAFGTLIKPSTGSSTVTIGTGGDTVGVVGTAVATGTASRAKFTVGGEGGQTYAITVPATMTMTAGANTLTVSLTSSATTGTLSGSLGAPGSQAFQVGGSFTLSSSQVSGDYSGSFDVTTAYN